jgi:GT2 family glycosyltransferase
VGASETNADWVFFMNPDAEAQPDCVERLLEAVADDRVGAVGAQVLLPDGAVNAGDNPLHMNGVSWAGRYGEQAERGLPREVAVASGAAVMVRRSAWNEVGGMSSNYFLYHDDVDLALRLRICGWSVLFQPGAHVQHDYEFEKGRAKWFFLERNRAWTVLTVYSLQTLLLLTPLLAATEVAVLARSVLEGWWSEKLRAWGSVISSAPQIARRRKSVQKSRVAPDSSWLELTADQFDTPLASSGVASIMERPTAMYRRAVVAFSR